jgi:hypothetical protein
VLPERLFSETPEEWERFRVDPPLIVDEDYSEEHFIVEDDIIDSVYGILAR